VNRVERILGTRSAGPGDEAEARSLPLPSDTKAGRVSFY